MGRIEQLMGEVAHRHAPLTPVSDDASTWTLDRLILSEGARFPAEIAAERMADARFRLRLGPQEMARVESYICKRLLRADDGAPAVRWLLLLACGPEGGLDRGQEEIVARTIGVIEAARHRLRAKGLEERVVLPQFRLYRSEVGGGSRTRIIAYASSGADAMAIYDYGMSFITGARELRRDVDPNRVVAAERAFYHAWEAGEPVTYDELVARLRASIAEIVVEEPRGSDLTWTAATEFSQQPGGTAVRRTWLPGWGPSAPRHSVGQDVA
jgi:hypothetical protein